MARLTEEEKRELLEDALSSDRRKEFAAIREGVTGRRLSPEEFIEFLDWSQQFMNEAPHTRPPIQGSTFLI